MDTLSTRTLTSQLGDDLDWLEQHSRNWPEQSQLTGQLRLGAALVRNCIGPFLDGQPPRPLHIVVVGGAGAGKSTVANLLCGVPAAEANPQAGFTRHPIAYTASTAPIQWSSFLGFLGPLTRLMTAGPSSIDEDVYQVRRVQTEQGLFDLLKDHVVWDCPDMTTWAAESYVSRLIEAAALADVIVYVASDERYNDEIPTQFLRMLLETGKPVIACIVKMREADAPALVAHFKKEVLGHLPNGVGRGVIDTLAIPFLTREQLANPAREAGKYRLPIINQVLVLDTPPAKPAPGQPVGIRQRTVAGAANYLARTQDHLLDVARQDVQALETWKGMVASGQSDFVTRYVREYLSTEKFRGFDDAMVHLLDMLELPGIGRIISVPLYILRTPYRLLRDWLGRTFSRPDAVVRPEKPILDEDLAGWLDMLHKEAAHRGGSHQLWRHITQGFQSGTLPDGARERLEQGFRTFQVGLHAEIEHTARSLFEELAKKPVLLNTLRSGKLALDVAALGGTLALGPLNWHQVILVPLVASLTHQLVELLGWQVVDAQREATRQRQRALMVENVAKPLGEWLTQWPATGGSSFERLQLALRRIPDAISQINARVATALGPDKPSAGRASSA
jgi:50S ribosome-binding GTPase